jgi:transposase
MNREEQRLRGWRWWREGVPQAEIARRLGLSAMTLSRWVARWRQTGGDAPPPPDRRGARPRLNARQEAELRRALTQPHPGGRPWTPDAVCRHIRRLYEVNYHPGHVRRLLRRLGLPPLAPRGRPRKRPGKAPT